MFTTSTILALCLSTVARAATVIYDFNITWVTANPDGVFPRPVVGINGQWPIPYLTATVGDQVIVNVNNQLGNQSTSLHFHGLYMNGTTDMDGPIGTTQCGIPPGASFKYNFTVSLLAFPQPYRLLITNFRRSINRALTGITPMRLASILMACAAH